MYLLVVELASQACGACPIWGRNASIEALAKAIIKSTCALAIPAHQTSNQDLKEMRAQP
jgi:hypothetical protein